MNNPIVILHLHPHKQKDSVLTLDLVHPQQDGFWLLSGFLVYEPDQWLVDLLHIFTESRPSELSQEDMYSMYYYCISFPKPQFVDITNEYMEGYALRLSYTNAAKIISAILEFRKNFCEKYLELTLTKEEGPYPIPIQ